MHFNISLDGTNVWQAVSILVRTTEHISILTHFPVKYLSSLWKGPAFAEKLKNKMKDVEIASQAMDDRGSQSGQLRLKEIRDVAVHSMVTL